MDKSSITNTLLLVGPLTTAEPSKGIKSSRNSQHAGKSLPVTTNKRTYGLYYANTSLPITTKKRASSGNGSQVTKRLRLTDDSDEDMAMEVEDHSDDMEVEDHSDAETDDMEVESGNFDKKMMMLTHLQVNVSFFLLDVTECYSCSLSHKKDS